MRPHQSGAPGGLLCVGGAFAWAGVRAFATRSPDQYRRQMRDRRASRNSNIAETRRGLSLKLNPGIGAAAPDRRASNIVHLEKELP